MRNIAGKKRTGWEAVDSGSIFANFLQRPVFRSTYYSRKRPFLLHLALTEKVGHFRGLKCGKSRPKFYGAETLFLFGFATYASATLVFQLTIRRWICNAMLLSVPSVGDLTKNTPVDGYSTQQGERKCWALGSNQSGQHQRSKGKKIIEAQKWKSQPYRQARAERSAMETLVFTLKESFEFGEMMGRTHENVLAEMLEKVAAYNISQTSGCGRSFQSHKRSNG